MLALLKNSLIDIRYTYKQHIIFGFLFMLLLSFCFVPIISFVFHRLLLMIGTGTLLNAEVYQVGLSYAGLAVLVLVLFLSSVVMFIQFGVMIVMACQRYFRQPLLISDALWATVRNIPLLLGFGLFQFMFFFLLLVPFIDFPLPLSLIDFNLPIFIASEIHASYLSMVGYSLLLLAVLYLLLRWVFALHFILIGGQSSWKAMKSSFALTRHNKLYILITMALLNFTVFLLGFALMSLLSSIPDWFGTNVLGFFIRDYLVTFSSIVALILAQLLLPVNVTMLTRLFFRYEQERAAQWRQRLHVQGMRQWRQLEEKVSCVFQRRKLLLPVLFIVGVTGLYVYNEHLGQNVTYLKWHVEVAAHRGDSAQAPENSISSIRSAVEKGVPVVEIDVMLTRDGVAVLNHDRDLQRVAGVAGFIENMTYAEIARIDIGSPYSEDYAGERIPTLDEVLREFQDEPIKFMIDLKPNAGSEALAREVVRLIERYELEDRTYIQAFDYEALQEVRRLNDRLKIGQIMYLSLGSLSGLDVDFYTINQSMLTESFIQAARRENREVWVWTVNIERNIQQVLRYDIDGIITDYPGRVQQMLGFQLVDQHDD